MLPVVPVSVSRLALHNVALPVASSSLAQLLGVIIIFLKLLSLSLFLSLFLWSRRPSAKNPPPFPTYYPEEDGADALPKEAYVEDIHQPSESTIIFTQDDATKKEVRTGAKLAKVRAKK